MTAKMNFPQEFRRQTKQVAVWFGMIVVLTLLDRVGDGRIIHWLQGVVFMGAVTYSVMLAAAARR
jgi:hypothetical protein